MRLIDAEKVIFESTRGTSSPEDMGFWSGIAKALSTILAQPTIDAVEVVRCCDCQYFTDSYIACDGYRCKPRCDLANGLKIPSKYTFCSYGKRKE